MRELSRLTKETIHLGALDEDSIVYIHKIDSMYNLRMYSRIGRRNPLYSTAIGKCFWPGATVMRLSRFSTA